MNRRLRFVFFLPFIMCVLVMNGCASKPKEMAPSEAAKGDPWFAAARSADIAALKSMMAAGRPVDAPSKTGMTALMMAARAGNLETTKWLLEQGAVASKVDQDGQSALVYALVGAAMGPKLERVVEELVKAGANPFAIDVLGFQPVQQMLDLDMDDQIRKLKFTDKKPCDLVPVQRGEVSLSKAARRRNKIALAEFLEREGCW